MFGCVAIVRIIHGRKIANSAGRQRGSLDPLWFSIPLTCLIPQRNPLLGRSPHLHQASQRAQRPASEGQKRQKPLSPFFGKGLQRLQRHLNKKRMQPLQSQYHPGSRRKGEKPPEIKFPQNHLLGTRSHSSLVICFSGPSGPRGGRRFG